MRRLLLLLTLVVGLLAAAAPTSAATTGVSITSTGFRPASVTVVAGDAVTWTNNDAVRHQVVANDGTFSSPVLAANQSFTHVFRNGGSFAYHDAIRPRLRGAVAVIPLRTVWITRSGFRPTPVSIDAGETVTWVNRTAANHQIVADDGSFNSGVLARGATFTHTFALGGTVVYHDGLQPSLKGSVVVKAAPVAESLTIGASSRVVTYGGTALLRGTLENGKAGSTVTVIGNPQAGRTVRSVLTVQTAVNGTFSVRVRPLVQTVYVASTTAASSRPLTVNVRPRLRLGLSAHRTRATLRVTAAQGFVRRYALLQVWRPRSGVWSSTKRVRLTRSIAGTSPTVVTTASFRMHMRHGLRVRMLMPRSQSVPGYVAGVSNVART
jgi:plastocyanin